MKPIDSDADSSALPFVEWWRNRVIAEVDHVAVVAKVHEESSWSTHYLFMTLMSAGIAVLGLLLSSPAVVIGVMLISPLMVVGPQRPDIMKAKPSLNDRRCDRRCGAKCRLPFPARELPHISSASRCPGR